MAKTVFSVLEDNKGIKCSIENYGDYTITIYPAFSLDKRISNDVTGKSSWGRTLSFNKEYAPSRVKEQAKLYKIFKLLYYVVYYAIDKPLEQRYNLFMELLFKDVCNNDLELFATYAGGDIDTYFLKYFSLKEISLMMKDIKENNKLETTALPYLLREYRAKFAAKQMEEMIPFVKSPLLKELILKQYNTPETLKRNIKDIQKYYKFLVQDIKKEHQTEKTLEEYNVKLTNAIQEITTTIPAFVNDYFNIVLKTKNSARYDIRDYIDYYLTIDELCSSMKVTRKTNPMTYVELRNYIQILRDEYDAFKHKFFADNQKQLNAEWNNEQYEIIIPYTMDDCVKIGNKFHNCFGTIEWRNYFATGMRYGACIVDKATKKPLVCLDIDKKTKEIIQYLAPNNSSISKDSPFYPKEMREEIRKVILKNILE